VVNGITPAFWQILNHIGFFDRLEVCEAAETPSATENRRSGCERGLPLW
jgi:hypothetical protein